MRSRARRPRPSVVPPELAAALERVNIGAAIAAELGIGPRQQLEIVFAAAPRASFVPEPPCGRCRRRGYHLAGCPAFRRRTR